MSTEIKKFKEFVVEASLGRVFQIVKDKKNSFGLVTAFRGEYDLKTNRTRNRQLSAEIRKNGFGFIKIVGHYIENKGTPEEIKVKEESFFINGGTKNVELKTFLKKAVKKYNQDSIIFRDSDTKDGKAIFIDKNYHETSVGNLSVGKIGDFMSQISGKRNATFVFENIEVPPTWTEKLRLNLDEER